MRENLEAFRVEWGEWRALCEMFHKANSTDVDISNCSIISLGARIKLVFDPMAYS